MDDKRRLRHSLRIQRDALTEAERAEKSQQILQHLAPFWAEAQQIATYFPIGSEVDIWSVLSPAVRSSIALPVITGTRVFFCQADGPLTPHPRYQIPEPLEGKEMQPDLIIVPMLGFDAHFHRLGYGGGFYDRSLPHYPRARIMGVAFAAQQLDAIPHQAHDVRMDNMITENGLL